MMLKMEVPALILFLCLAAFTHAQSVNGTSALVPLVDGNDNRNNTSTDATSTDATTTGSTAAQSSTTSAPVTTTMAPEPKASTWFVQDAGVYCIVAHLGARFTFNYTGNDSKSYTVQQDLPSHPNATKTDGFCESATQQNITLSYGTNAACKMTMNFINKSNKFSVNLINLNFAQSCFPENPPKVAQVTGTINRTLFQAAVGQSYLCNAEQDLNATTNINSLRVELVEVQLQAFSKSNKTDFGTPQECPQDAETSNIVPIAVGAALAALVLIVLIAYLISRNRGQRGYESV